jgi:1,4-dihydroxy-2-naphthoate octaprenyltransferase
MKGSMTIDAALFAKLDTYPHIVLSWVGDDGYPNQTAATFRTDAARNAVVLAPTGLPAPIDRVVNATVSHIRPQPGTGYDERRYISLWGHVSEAELPSPAGEGQGERSFTPTRAWGWDEAEVPFFEYSERSNPQAQRYMRQLSAEQGREVKPRLSRAWTFILATRLPFLTATFVPVLLGLAIAGYNGAGNFNWWLAALTLVGAAAIHIGLNVANDVFDALSGADDANVNPTQFSGGSRVIQYGLVTLRQMSAISIAAYAVGAATGVYLLAVRWSPELLAIGVAGLLLSVFYTAPPLRLVHRGLGELTTALGFGPIMVLGAYVVQTRELAWEPFVASMPVAIFIALILYVNEIPDRTSDAVAGKRTLVVRWSRDTVTTMFLASVVAAYAVLAIAAITRLIPLPTLLALLTLPLALQVYNGIRQYYTSPYELMATMAKNVQLHALFGTLLFAGYVIAIVADAALDSPPSLLS